MAIFLANQTRHEEMIDFETFNDTHIQLTRDMIVLPGQHSASYLTRQILV